METEEWTSISTDVRVRGGCSIRAEKRGSEKMEKGKIKAAEMRKLKRIFKEIPENKKKIVEKLIDNAAFMAEQLEHLQEDIQEKGYISEYQNGENQWGTKKAPEVEIYNTTIKHYSGVIKQLLDLMPETDENAVDELALFHRERERK